MYLQLKKTIVLIYLWHRKNKQYRNLDCCGLPHNICLCNIWLICSQHVSVEIIFKIIVSTEEKVLHTTSNMAKKATFDYLFIEKLFWK